MFHGLTLRSFKAWRGENRLALAPLTLFLGVNSAGKTSLLQPLLLLQQTIESPDRRVVLELGGAIGDALNLGGFDDLVSDHDPTARFGFSLGFGPVEIGDGATRERFDHVVCEVEYARSGAGAPSLVRMAYQTPRGTWAAVREPDGRYRLEAPGVAPGSPSSAPRRELAPERSIAWSLDAIAAFGPAAAAAQDLALALTRELRAIAYLGPLRDQPSRVYAWNGRAPSQIGRKGELAVQALISSEHGANEHGGALVERVSRWLSRMEVADRLELERQGSSNVYQVTVVRGRERANLVDVGFGVSQVLPVVVLAHLAPEGSTVILEQPEIHLHPLAQSVLADLFVEVSRERSLQFLVETHSEHLFRRLQSHLAAEATTPEQCALYFVDRDAAGDARLRTLEIDPFGRVRNWPDRFFGDTAGEVERQTRKMLERMRARRG